MFSLVFIAQHGILITQSQALNRCDLMQNKDGDRWDREWDSGGGGDGGIGNRNGNNIHSKDKS